MGNFIQQIAGFAASMGVNEVVGNVIKSTTPEGLSKYKKGLVFVGTMVIGGIAGEKAKKYVDDQFDEAKKLMAEFNKDGAEDDGQ
jgi:hypothetical protein